MGPGKSWWSSKYSIFSLPCAFTNANHDELLFDKIYGIYGIKKLTHKGRGIDTSFSILDLITFIQLSCNDHFKGRDGLMKTFDMNGKSN